GVSPAAAFVAQGLTQQFTAMMNGGAMGATWSATAGSINVNGMYTAPAQIPNPPTITITAAASGQTATATVTIVSNAPPTISQVNPTPVPVGVLSLDIAGAGFTTGTQATLGGTALT